MNANDAAKGGAEQVGTCSEVTPNSTRTATIAPLDKRSAEKLTAEIKSWAGTLWLKLRQAHDGQAWKPLGYKSWAEYVRVEFDMSRSYAYQLVSHARAVEALAEAAGLPEVSGIADTLPPDTTRYLDLPAATEAVVEAVADLDEDATDEVRAATVAATVDAIRRAKRKAARSSRPPTPQLPAPPTDAGWLRARRGKEDAKARVEARRQFNFALSQQLFILSVMADNPDRITEFLDTYGGPAMSELTLEEVEKAASAALQIADRWSDR